ncbi:hypothetical protein [Streptomyces drozdowiczii]|uniref:hypothetical protein n=1 Tax=Streptomyces drozdowiczii TaxID=202862 RepID=UPI0031EB2228
MKVAAARCQWAAPSLAIGAGLATVADHALELGALVHMPRIGCGLAGGTWSRIEPLIESRLTGRGLSVSVCDFD